MKRKLSVVFLIIAVLISALVIDVNAESFSTSLTASKNQIAPSEDVIITISVSNLNVGDQGISGFSATFNYDTTVFETVTDSNMEGMNSWSPTYSTGTNTITLKKNSFVNKDEDMLQITLKAKSNVAEGKSGTVALSKVSVSGSDDNFNGSDVSTTISIGRNSNVEIPSNNSVNNNPGSIQIRPSTNTPINTPAPVNNNTNANNATPINNANTNSNTNSVANRDLPYTGPLEDAMIKIILGVVLVSLFIYIKIEKMNEVK